jgi:aspartokinase
MTSTRLGGFKVLKDVARVSLILPEEGGHLPVEFFRVIAKEEINLPYATCIQDGRDWGLTLAVEAAGQHRISLLLEETARNAFGLYPKSAILSIFPHRRKPEITGALFESLGQREIRPRALANSPSAISVFLDRDSINGASEALFGPFTFSAYRTPSDWKLAQKGKEQLYKEVVASYQEKKPKVYGLEYQDGQELLRVGLNNRNIGDFGAFFKEFARLGLHLTFLATSPSQDAAEEKVVFCLPGAERSSHRDVVKDLAPEATIDSISPVATFTMNGPHFGDRYGIISELLASFDTAGIDLLGLSCTIASITGVVHIRQLESALQAIQTCFEVPVLTKK